MSESTGPGGLATPYILRYAAPPGTQVEARN
jgi:hypothetical protein